jgi:hypothetical protein
VVRRLDDSEARPKLKILVNSMPKSGTHLLSRIVELLGYCNISSNRGLIKKLEDHLGLGSPTDLAYRWVRRNWKRRIYARIGKSCHREDVSIGGILAIQVPAHLLVQWLRVVSSGYFIIGHLPYSPTTDAILQQLKFKHIAIIRDPRDVLVSFIHYAQRAGGSLRADLMSLSKDKQIAFALEGGFAPISGIKVTGIKNAFRSIMDWKQTNNLLLLRFEDLVGAKGGGLYDKQYKVVKEICSYLEINADENIVTRVCADAFDNHSPTFRKGQIGSWKNELTLEQSISFSQRYGWLIDELHYD